MNFLFYPILINDIKSDDTENKHLYAFIKDSVEINS